MSALTDASGAVFASGALPCFMRHAFDGDRLTRLFIHVQIGDAPTPAVVDTGGGYLVIDPQLAAHVGLSRADALAVEHIHIRGFAQRSQLAVDGRRGPRLSNAVVEQPQLIDTCIGAIRSERERAAVR